MTTPSDKPDSNLNIELDPKTAEGIYSNLVMIAHSSEEFILDFIRIVPGVTKARVKSRIIITPAHARRLLDALRENIERFEATHGPIGPGQKGPPVIKFQIPGGEA